MAQKTAKQIINRVAGEVGLPTSESPYSSADESMIQLRTMLATVVEELAEAFNWQILRREHSFTTSVPPDDNIYDLPSDFVRMTDQTGWQRTNRVPLFGPVSAQQWQYLEGRDLSSSTIYASFRLTQGKLYLYPTTPPDGIEIAYEYTSNNFYEDADIPGTYLTEATADADIVQLDARLVERGLKARFLQARGFDSTVASQEYQNSYDQLTGNETSAPVLDAGQGGWQYPYLSGLRNTPDSGFGGAT
jgi:hypothetical protein